MADHALAGDAHRPATRRSVGQDNDITLMLSAAFAART